MKPAIEVCQKCKHYDLQHVSDTGIYLKHAWCTMETNIIGSFDKSQNYYAYKHFKMPEKCPLQLEHMVCN